ncbi:cytochrome c oxidase assembly protein subunit 15 [Asanoa hainanensis]|uniref:Cytochrome c oxidase assembly protein subunit 15 n=1 Tax=Asanoa hainanensis TaxID=560556 RepID=A0A239P5X4_9ACTN|nr:COX15/CtaA family protein [Asanoa hainanensis]SNT62506.1 cytochrome c oxidase assembly protein subunit 15 [Asanoa hainanensis]
MIPLLRRLALANIIANVAIVVTGGAVRLTGSGLGCPTWPRCTDASYVPNGEMGIHGVIEFSNRMLGWVVGAVALATLIAAFVHHRRERTVGSRRLNRLALGVFLGIPAQGVVGGITVLTNLNPWVVGLHFLASIGVLAAAYALWRRTVDGPGPRRTVVPSPLRQLVWVLTVVSLAVVALGVIVTGSGPHAGDVDAHRTGLDPETISQVHADVVFLLLGLTLAVWFAARATGARRTARAALVLLAIELSQGVIGFVQYFTGLPEILVGLHMLGACLVWLATLSVLWSTRGVGDGGGEALGSTAAGAEEERGLGELQLDQDGRTAVVGHQVDPRVEEPVPAARNGVQGALGDGQLRG